MWIEETVWEDTQVSRSKSSVSSGSCECMDATLPAHSGSDESSGDKMYQI